MRSSIVELSFQSLLSTVFRLFGRQNRQRGLDENVGSDVSVLQPPHHLELHSSAKVWADQAGAGPPSAELLEDQRLSIFLAKPASRGIVREV
jgi:hypothetical protein